MAISFAALFALLVMSASASSLPFGVVVEPSLHDELPKNNLPEGLLLHTYWTTFEGVEDVPLPSLRSTVHDELTKYGLPRGLLPDSVKSYSLSSNGEFAVELHAPCYVQFSDLVYYEKTIKGKLSYGAIADLSGIKAKKFLVWLPITGIVAHPKEKTVEFQVGFISESLPASQFDSIPACKAQASTSCRGAAGLLLEPLPISKV